MIELYVCSNSRTPTGKIKKRCLGCGHEQYHTPYDETGNGLCNIEEEYCGGYHCKTICTSENIEARNLINGIRCLLFPMSDKDRLKVFEAILDNYCVECGQFGLPCYCKKERHIC